METNNIEEILEEIRYHQSQSYLNWISAWARKIKVDRLHSRLDQLGYNGQRPPSTIQNHRNNFVNKKFVVFLWY